MTTPTTVQVQIQIRADTAANWASENPTLLANEIGRETDTGKIKIGDGTTAWTSLAYQPFGALIVNADIAANAEIAVSKLANGTANQALVTDGTDVSWSNDLTLAGNVTLNAQGDLRFADSDSSNWVAFQAPATVASNVTWTLPDADGTDGQVLSTNGTGTLSWTTASGGGGGNSLIFSMIF